MIEYTCFPLDGTLEATVEVESIAASESSDIEKDFSSHSDKRGGGEREKYGIIFSFFPFSLE